MDIQSTCDYIIRAMRRTGASLNVLKLQKLLYYAQAWHLALHGEPLFNGKFQAWAQGPVNREVYNRFARSNSLYSDLQACNVVKGCTAIKISKEEQLHLDHVLQAYGKFDEAQLQEMLSREAPWQEAFSYNEDRCEREIDEDHMRRYCTVQYLVGLSERNSSSLFGYPAFHLQSNPYAASAGNWLTRENNAAPVDRGSH